MGDFVLICRSKLTLRILLRSLLLRQWRMIHLLRRPNRLPLQLPSPRRRVMTIWVWICSVNFNV